MATEDQEGLPPPFQVTFKKVYKLTTSYDVVLNNPEDNQTPVDPTDPVDPVKPKYQITFLSAYKVSTSKSIRFNKTEYVPVPPSIAGEFYLLNNIRVDGSLYLEPRPSFPIKGYLDFTSKVDVVGVVSGYRLFSLSGSVPLSSFTLDGSVDVYTPYYLEGEVVLSSATTIFGEVKYKDDAFRGLRNSVEIEYRKLTVTTNKQPLSTYRHATPQFYGKSLPFRQCSKLQRATELVQQYTGIIRQHLYYLASFGMPVSNGYASKYNETIKYRVGYESPATWATHLEPKLYKTLFREMLRLRTKQDYSYATALPFGVGMTSLYQNAVPIYTKEDFIFRWCAKIVSKLQRSPVKPPDYVQPTAEDFNLRFKCPFRARSVVGDYNIYFNMTRCKKPYQINDSETYYVENTFSAKRVADEQPFNVLSLSLDTDMASWCWSMSAVIPETDLRFVTPLPNELALVEFTINGDVYRFLVEEINRSRAFGTMGTYTIKGRSISALLDEPHTDPISYTNSSEMSVIQLVKQLVYDAVGDTITVEWESLVSDIGWVIPPTAVNATGVSVIKLISDIVAPAGGVVFTHPSQPVIVIKKAYPYAHWEEPLMLNHTLAEAIITDEGTSWDRTTPKNGVYVTDPLTGNQTKVYRRGTSGDKLGAEIVSPILSTVEARSEGGKQALIQANIGEVKSLSFPFLPPITHIYPCDTLAVTTSSGSSEWGTITSVGLDVSVSDTGVVDVGYAVSVKRFMEAGLYV